MNHSSPWAASLAAQALATLVTANGRLDAPALAALDRLQTFERLAIDRDQFVLMAQACAHDIGAQLCECSWLRDQDLAGIDARLDPRIDPQTRLLICRLAFAAIAADGRVTDDERMVFEHALARWHVDLGGAARLWANERRGGLWTFGKLHAATTVSTVSYLLRH